MEIRDFPYVRLALFVLALCVGVGCAPAKAAPVVEPVGVFHAVESGQTLWRIAHTYEIPLEKLIESNQISDPTDVAIGKRLWIPGAAALREVIPFKTSTPTVAGGNWLWPVSNGRILSRYGAPRRTHTHKGLDIGGPAGDPVVAARAGRVVYSAAGMRGYGKTIILDHGDGVQTLYAHNSQLLVRSGERVEQGQIIARVGRTGNATTDHVHFEIRVDNRPIDPLTHLSPRSASQ